MTSKQRRSWSHPRIVRTQQFFRGPPHSKAAPGWKHQLKSSSPSLAAVTLVISTSLSERAVKQNERWETMGPWDKTTLFNANPFLQEILNHLGKTYCPIKHNTAQLDFHTTGVEVCENWFAWVHWEASYGQGVEEGRCQLGGGSLQAPVQATRPLANKDNHREPPTSNPPTKSNWKAS